MELYFFSDLNFSAWTIVGLLIFGRVSFNSIHICNFVHLVYDFVLQKVPSFASPLRKEKTSNSFQKNWFEVFASKLERITLAIQ